MEDMDFTKLGSVTKSSAPVDPIKIFETLPSREGIPNDLWRGQAEALSDWYKNKDKQDILISLNTGAGKTIVGLLIAQSLVNKKYRRVVYVCSTINLVEQTSREARGLGLRHSTRESGNFSDDEFETGKAFCITTYSALFSGYSHIRKKFFPDAIIFDDAHVAESILRSSFTLSIDSKDKPELFDEIVNLFRSHFRDLGCEGRFNDSIDRTKQNAVLVAPNGLYGQIKTLLEILSKHGVKDHKDFKYPFAWLEDRVFCYAATFSGGVFELTPPYMPSRAINIFENDVKRIYLSATLQNTVEFIRAFGRKPDYIVAPSSDAGNGERLILDVTRLEEGFGPEFAKQLVERHKTVIGVPSYKRAERWNKIAQLPNRKNFTKELDEFRSQQPPGAFLLVSRVDGIDLPRDTCRIMIIDGVPISTSLLERYQWEWLQMENVLSTRVANRIAQLFGRINRGRNDYGAYIIESENFSKWINTEWNLALLPPLLQKQILIGSLVQETFGLKSYSSVVKLIDRVFTRDEDWLDYYHKEVKLAKLDKEHIDQVKSVDNVMVEAALSEAKYAAAMWRGQPSLAREELEKSIIKTRAYDKKLAGWHYVWIGATYSYEGDKESAYESYKSAMQCNQSLKLPREPSRSVGWSDSSENFNNFGESLLKFLNPQPSEKFWLEIDKLKNDLNKFEVLSSNQAEENVRRLGELLGLVATRPDNDSKTGPDVLWRDEIKKKLIGFELKTKKKTLAAYNKEDINQGHDHLQWIENFHPEYVNLGLLIVGPNGVVTQAANPSNKMGLCLTTELVKLYRYLIAQVEDIHRKTPLERIEEIKKVTNEERWGIEALFEELNYRDMKELKQ